MADRRMFTKKITDSDAFIEMSSAAQALYFHLNQGADDDGFNNQIQMAMLKAHASTDDLKILMAKNFVIRFESGVIVIKHWRMHNTLRKDRYTPTNYQEELKLLGLKDNGAYTLDSQVVDTWLPSGCQVVAAGKVSIDKNSKDKISEGECSVVEDTTSLPTLQQIKEYVSKHNLNVDPDRFFSYYNKTNWKTTKGNPVNWQDKLQEWNSTEKKEDKPQKSSNPFLNALKNGDVGYDQ